MQRDLTTEQLWIEYARRIVDNAAHRIECASRGGSSPVEFPSSHDIRWPGYLGADYLAGGVLCIANIHRNFNSAGLSSSQEIIGAAESATRQWAKRLINDSEWINAMRDVYSIGLSKRGWTIGKQIAFVTENLGESVPSIAYANVARCQNSDNACHQLQRFCNSIFPLSELVAILKPRIVITVSQFAFSSLRGSVPIIYFHQLNGTLWDYDLLACELKRPLTHRESRASWCAKLKDSEFYRNF